MSTNSNQDDSSKETSMYFNSAVLYFVWAFLGMIVILLVRSLIVKQKQVPRYTLVEAR